MLMHTSLISQFVKCIWKFDVISSTKYPTYFRSSAFKYILPTIFRRDTPSNVSLRENFPNF